MMISLNLKGEKVLVVGGGQVAARRAEALLEAGARVRVISPAFVSAFAELSIERVERPFEPGDTAGAFLVVAATGDPAADEAVAAEARAAGRLVSVAGAPDLGNCHFAAEVHQGPITLGIATGGASPALARRLRTELEATIGPEWGTLAELLGEARERLKGRADLSQAERAAIYWKIVSGPALELLRAGKLAEAREIVEKAGST